MCERCVTTVGVFLAQAAAAAVGEIERGDEEDQSWMMMMYCFKAYCGACTAFNSARAQHFNRVQWS